MYYLATATPNKHVATTGFSKGKEVSHDSYRQVSGCPDTFKAVTEEVARLIGTSKPGTKIKLVATVPEIPLTPADEVAQLKARLAQLEGQK